MAKANLQLPDGTTVNIEGTADEVAMLLARFSGTAAPAAVAPPTASKPARKRNAAKAGGDRQPQAKAQGAATSDRRTRPRGFFQDKANYRGHSEETGGERAHLRYV